MEAVYMCLLVCVIDLPALFCHAESSQVLIESIVEELQNVKRDLVESKQHIQALQDGRNQNCKMENPVVGKSSNLKRASLSGSAVGFTACVSVPDLISLGAHHTILFDSVITNTGGAYHEHTGIFTAPLKGLYVFAATAMSSPGKSQYLDIMKDGVGVNNFYADARGQSYEVTGNQWVIELNQGSEVWIQTTNAGEIHGNCYTLFSGFLLSEME